MANDGELDDQPLGQIEERFATNLRAARERAGLSQEAVAVQMQEGGYPAFRQQTVARIEGGSRDVRLGEALALARITRTHINALARPQGLAEETWRILDAARSLRDASRAVSQGASRVTKSRADLERAIARAEESGHAETLADELFVGRRALAETRLTELRALAEEQIRAAVGRLLSPSEKALALRIAEELQALARDEGPVSSRQEAAWRLAHANTEAALAALLGVPETGDTSGEQEVTGS